MKKLIITLLFTLSFSSVEALTCVDITTSLVRRQENSRVHALQNFLFEKGYLKATPNGYFGAGTFSAVQAYQRSKGLEAVGNVGPGTRRAIKSDSCGTGSTASSLPSSTQTSGSSVTTTNTTTNTVTNVSTGRTIGKPPVVNTPLGLRNARRRDDIEKIIKSLYSYFVDSRGVHATGISETPIELCVVPKRVLPVQSASTTEVAVLATPASPCASHVDVTYLIPNYIADLPRDPSIATSSTLIGYMITRNDNNDITISAKSPEDSAIVKVTCNFNGFCKEIKHISSIPSEIPTLASSSRTTIVRDAVAKVPLLIYGKGFKGTSTVVIVEKYTRKTFTLGSFSSTNDKILSIDGSIMNKSFSCGNGCTENIPFGDYVLTVTTEGGTSNPIYFTLKGFTSSAFTARADTSVSPKSTNVKVGSITISSGVPVKIKSLTLSSTSTSKVLSGKVTKYVLKDPSEGTSITGSGAVFAFSNVSLYENQSRVYDVYIDVGEVLTHESGYITYGGYFTMEDSFSKVLMDYPTKEFSFSISY